MRLFDCARLKEEIFSEPEFTRLRERMFAKAVIFYIRPEKIVRFSSQLATEKSNQLENFAVENFFSDGCPYAENRFYNTFKNSK